MLIFGNLSIDDSYKLNHYKKVCTRSTKVFGTLSHGPVSVISDRGVSSTLTASSCTRIKNSPDHYHINIYSQIIVEISVTSDFQKTDVSTSSWYVETTDTIEFCISRCFDMSKYRYTFVELSVHICRNIGTSKQRYVETTVLPPKKGQK